MDIPAWESYVSTLWRWALVGGGMMILVILLQKFLSAVGVKREAATGYALISPWMLGFLIWTLYPFMRSLYLSFTEYNIFQPPQWVGAQNYVEMFTRDPQFWRSLRLTLLYALLNVPLGLIGSLGVALLLNRDIKGIGVWRTIYYLPAVLPGAAVALLWRWMFSPRSGLINFVLQPIYRLFNMDPLAWFTEPDLVLPAFVIMGMWGVFGTNSVILLAGLKNIPRQLYEVAELDGANGWQKFWNVTLPMLSSTMFYNVVTGIIGALQIFTVAFFINIPQRAGTFFNVRIYQEAFSFRHMGYASAMAWFLLVIILLLTLFVFRSSALWVFYAGEKE
jgi:multiple sugar transport system permease protein